MCPRTLLGSLSQFQGRGNYTDLVLRAEDGEVECHKVSWELHLHILLKESIK